MPTSRAPSLLKHLLWIDCGAAVAAGVGTLAISGSLARLEGLPRSVLVFVGVANLVYGAFSFSLAVRARRPMALITFLVVANAAWVPVCLGLVAAHAAVATPFAYVHLVGEAGFVGGLAVLEWRSRSLLSTAP